MSPRKRRFWPRHSLSVVSGAILLLWIISYFHADEHTHLGSFFGNAIADWTGLVVMVLATKFFFEKDSVESRRPTPEPGAPNFWRIFIHNHSLTIFLLLTGALWVVLYIKMDSESKWGQVVGNIVSEWTQTLGAVVLTKRLVEIHSKESKEE